ncbi:hypothetical protein [Paenibacillus spongiae]|uniref:Uncharacterized protein n=1 Tax=Paenibacillus spongiae TaxID=2909671 RepID=A0ABY5S8Q7_9BACL|nr:hypothetical protein [Paenibacillus spongiae]UVI28708.1 hypothetical protein L1F29_25195 [Paenibacillus spongiae]
MDEHTICPWCQTEIVWDEEIGPERYCPHCENELSGYRTMQIGIDDSEDDEDDEDEDDEEEVEESWDSDRSFDESAGSFLTRSREHLMLEETVERILDQQVEVPECPSCREYMLEVGVEHVTGSQFNPAQSAGLNTPLLTAPFRIIRYVCPSCFSVLGKLAQDDQERMVHVLTKASDESS